MRLCKYFEASGINGRIAGRIEVHFSTMIINENERGNSILVYANGLTIVAEHGIRDTDLADRLESAEYFLQLHIKEVADSLSMAFLKEMVKEKGYK